MKNSFKLMLLSAALLSIPMNAATSNTATSRLASALVRLKTAAPAAAKVAFFGTTSSLAMGYALQNFELLLIGGGTYNEAYKQTRKIAYFTFGPILYAIAHQLMGTEEVQEEYLKKDKAPAQKAKAA